jgi:nucleoside-diphosphate-sugar epimerase
MKVSRRKLLNKDLQHILTHTRDLWEELRDGRLFVTGGTGFVGTWLLESFVDANQNLGLGAEVVVLSRNPDAFHKKAPHLTSLESVQFLQGDVREFEFPKESFTHVIHAASEVEHLGQDPLLELSTLFQGTQHVLKFAQHCNAQKFLLISSGGVYGKQPSELKNIPESYQGAPDPCDAKSFYGEGKRLAELLGIQFMQQGLEVKIARGFTFIGPYLPLDAHFAIGNFIRDALRGGPIIVKGDGLPRRSYLYAADFTVWLWVILFRGISGRPYNVGSDHVVSIIELARLVANIVDPALKIEVKGKMLDSNLFDQYIPDTERAKKELNLKQRISLEEGIRHMVEFCQSL